MTTRVVALLAAAMAATLLPTAVAFAQVEHAQRVAMEVAIRRAQVRAALCEQQQQAVTPPRPGTVQTAPRLPSSPPVGTAGPVPLGDCSRGLWPLGR